MSFPTHKQELEFLEKLGFPTNPYNTEADTLEEVWEIASKIDKEKSDLAYPIDGLVVKLNDNDLVEKLGVVGKTPRGWCAIKFKAQEVTTKIVGITWQVGRTGRVTPVADLEAVEVGGTTVKRATLHNFKEFCDKDMCFNDTLVIRKAGEIIPEVVNVLENLRLENHPHPKLPYPRLCPSCDTELKKSSTDIDLVCPNQEHCPAQVVGRLSYFCQRNIGNITGLSEKQIEKFVEKFGMSDIPDIFDLPFEEIQTMEGFGKKSIENLQLSINKAREIPDYRFLAGLGIEGIGVENAKLICEKLWSVTGEEFGIR